MDKKNNKILWYIHPYCGGPNIGPAFRPFYFCKEFSKANFLPLIISPNWHHLMYNKEDKLKNQNIEGVNYYFINSKKYIGNGYQRMIHMILFPIKIFFNKELKSKYKPDVIISSSPHLFTFISAYFISKKYNAKLILEVRDIWPLSLIEIAGVSKIHPIVILLGVIEKFAYKKSNYIVTFFKNSKLHFSKYNIDTDKVHYIPNGSIVRAVPKIENDEIISYIKKRKNKGNFIIGYTGAHGTPNALKQLLEANLILKDSNIDKFDIIMIGDGIEKTSLMSFAQDNKLGNIHFFDPVSKDRIQAIISLFDTCYLATKRKKIYKYGISQNKLFEYMGASKPILSSMYLDTIVEDAKCGVIADCENPGDLALKIKDLLNMDKTILNKFGKYGFQYLSNNHNIKNLAKDYIKLF